MAAESRRRKVGWEARVFIYRRAFPEGLTDRKCPLIVWRPTEAWAKRVAERKEERVERRYRRRNGKGEFAWKES